MKFIFIDMCVSSGFFFSLFSCILLYRYLTIYLPIDKTLEFLSIINNTFINIWAHAFVRTYVFISLGQLSKSGNAGSYSECIFNFIRNCQIFPEMTVTIWHSHRECIRGSVASHSEPHRVWSVFLILAIQVGV